MNFLQKVIQVVTTVIKVVNKIVQHVTGGQGKVAQGFQAAADFVNKASGGKKDDDDRDNDDGPGNWSPQNTGGTGTWDPFASTQQALNVSYIVVSNADGVYLQRDFGVDGTEPVADFNPLSQDGNPYSSSVVGAPFLNWIYTPPADPLTHDDVVRVIDDINAIVGPALTWMSLGQMVIQGAGMARPMVDYASAWAGSRGFYSVPTAQAVDSLLGTYARGNNFGFVAINRAGRTFVFRVPNAVADRTSGWGRGNMQVVGGIVGARDFARQPALTIPYQRPQDSLTRAFMPINPLLGSSFGLPTGPRTEIYRGLYNQDYLVIHDGAGRVMVTQGGSTRYYDANYFETEVRPQFLEEQIQVLTDAGFEIDPETGELMLITNWPIPAQGWPIWQGGATQAWQENSDGTVSVILSQHGDGGGNGEQPPMPLGSGSGIGSDEPIPEGDDSDKIVLDLFSGPRSNVRRDIPGYENAYIFSIDIEDYVPVPGVQADATTLPFKDNSVDEVFVTNAYNRLIRELPSGERNEWRTAFKQAYFAEIARVLVPGGRLIISIPRDNQFSKPFDSRSRLLPELQEMGFEVDVLYSGGSSYGPLHPALEGGEFGKPDTPNDAYYEIAEEDMRSIVLIWRG